MLWLAQVTRIYLGMVPSQMVIKIVYNMTICERDIMEMSKQYQDKFLRTVIPYFECNFSIQCTSCYVAVAGWL